MSASVLESVDFQTMEEKDAFDIWEHVRKQKACFDDFNRDRADIFLARIANPNSATFRFPEGLVLLESIVPRLSANIHFFLWRNLRDVDILRLGNDALREAFETYQVHRLNAYPPEFNKQAQRIAVRLGFKWEGCLRQQFLYEGTYHDVMAYGLLAQEFAARRAN